MIISRTPLRISFAGGGTDFPHYYQAGYGAVVSTAINKYIYATVNKKFDDQIRVGYSKSEMVDDVEKIEHHLIREALKLTGVTRGVDISYMSDMLPAREGTGLGASSSLTVGILKALHAFLGQAVSAEQIAREACNIELEILKHPIGKQDQYATAFGNFNYIKFHADERVTVEPIPCQKETLEQLDNNLLLFYTGLSSQSAEVLPEQENNIETNRHVLDKMLTLAEELKKSLMSNRLDDFGDILHQNWLYKQKLASKITNLTINTMYEAARAAGAIGGKVLGSGGGGFLLVYCEEAKQPRVRAALNGLRETTFKFEPQESTIVYNEKL